MSVPQGAAAWAVGGSPGSPWAKPRIAPVPLPHVACGPWCPFCPEGGGGEPGRWTPGPEDVARAVATHIPPAGDGDGLREIAFYGGDFAVLPRGSRDSLLDAAEGYFRRGRATGIRAVMGPASLAVAPLADFRARGLRTVEIPALALDDRVLAEARAPWRAAQVRNLVARLRLQGFRVGLALVPGLPADSHERALGSAHRVVAARPDFVRVLPALALRGTRLGRLAADGRWLPMTLAQAVETCKEVVRVLRRGGVEVVRVGLQPETDIRPEPEVVAGPAHRCLRTLVEAALYRQLAVDLLAERCRFGKSFVLRVSPGDESYLRGPENANIRELRRRFRLDRLLVVLDPAVPRYELRGEPGGRGDEGLPRREAS